MSANNETVPYVSKKSGSHDRTTEDIRPKKANKNRSGSAPHSDRQLLPNFLIIGAQKSGTTALYHYLDQHPEVFMSKVKEPNFLAFEGQKLSFIDVDGRPAPIVEMSITDLDDYAALFVGAEDARAIGEASPHYLYLPDSIDRIKKYIPDARLIVMLRNPVDRAYSAYMHAVSSSREPERDFNRALALEEERLKRNIGFLYRYKSMGFYGAQLEPFFKAFGPDRIHVILHEDFTRQTESVLRGVFEFIGVDPSFKPDTSVRHNRSGIPRNPFIHRMTDAFISRHGFVRRLFRNLVPESLRDRLPGRKIVGLARQARENNYSKPSMPADARENLKVVFQDDIIKLQKLIGRDLSSWLS